jgi:hypothetical protein
LPPSELLSVLRAFIAGKTKDGRTTAADEEKSPATFDKQDVIAKGRPPETATRASP